MAQHQHTQFLLHDQTWLKSRNTGCRVRSAFRSSPWRADDTTENAGKSAFQWEVGEGGTGNPLLSPLHDPPRNQLPCEPSREDPLADGTCQPPAVFPHCSLGSSEDWVMHPTGSLGIFSCLSSSSLHTCHPGFAPSRRSVGMLTCASGSAFWVMQQFS